MQCPACSEYNERVLRSREDIKDNVIRRIRVCLNCGLQIVTVERIDMRATRSFNAGKQFPDQT
jgi:transcriptional regulator NrdR family protein